MSSQTIYAGIHNATSSPESERGATHYEDQDGRTTDQYGQVPAHANLSARQAKALGLLMSGTYGLRGTISLASAALQWSLASRLRARTAMLGSTLFNLTWKQQVTPSGRSFYLLRASVLRTSASGFGSWPPLNVTLNHTAALAGWVTTTMRDWKDSPGMATQRSDGRSRLDQLPRQAQLMDFGQMPTGYPAVTASGGQLNPAHSRWLMGLPPAWDVCAPTAMPLSRRSRRNS
jgi:hypothetical protein